MTEEWTIISPVFERTQAVPTHTAIERKHIDGALRIALLNNGKRATVDPLFGAAKDALQRRYGVTTFVHASKPSHAVAVSSTLSQELIDSSDLIVTAIGD